MESMELEVDVQSNSFSENETSVESQWNGRAIMQKSSISDEIEEKINVLCHEVTSKPEAFKCSFNTSYLDPEAKKAQEFEIRVLLNAVRCSSMEEENAKIRELVSLADGAVLSAGLIAIAVISRDYKSALSLSTALFYLFKEKLYLTYNQLKKLLEERGKEYEDLLFYAWWEDYQKNEQELRSQGLLIDPYSPHYVDNPHYTDNSHYQKPLDSSFKPWG